MPSVTSWNIGRLSNKNRSKLGAEAVVKTTELSQEAGTEGEAEINVKQETDPCLLLHDGLVEGGDAMGAVSDPQEENV